MTQLTELDCKPPSLFVPRRPLRHVPPPPWMRLQTPVDLLEARVCRREEEAEIQKSTLAQLIRIPTGPYSASVHNVLDMEIIPLQTMQEIWKSGNWATEPPRHADWTKKFTYTIYRHLSYANACYLPLPLRRIPCHEPVVVARCLIAHFPPLWQGDHLYRDVSRTTLAVNAAFPEYKNGVTSHRAQCLVKGCDCGNMIFETEYERNRHMDGCFEGRHVCTGCKTVFQLHDDGLVHVESGCPTSEYAEVITIDPVPHWRKKDSEYSKLLIVPHSADHLYEELGYAAIV